MADVIVEGIYFGEAPRWHEDRLWYSDFFGHAVHTLAADGHDEIVLRIDGDPSGLGWLPDGRLLVVSMWDHRVLRVEHDGEVVVHGDVSTYARHRSNDMVVDRVGRAYVGNFGFDNEESQRTHRPPVPTSLARVDPDGSVVEAATDLLFPNGTVILPDGKTMIIAETFGQRLTAFDIAEDGTLAGRRVWADLSPTGVYPDGICLDVEGAVWVASPSEPRCVRVGLGGVVLEEVTVSQNCFACALGGDDLRTLYALTAPTSNHEIASLEPRGRVEAIQVEVPGVGSP